VTIAAPTPPGHLLLEVIRLRDEANAVSTSLLGSDHALVGPMSLSVPRLEPAELGFLRTVAWLYVHYYEAGLVGIRFLVGLFDVYGLDAERQLRGHQRTTGRLRSYLQHNLDLSSDHDLETRATCEEWFDLACRSRVPGSEEHWLRCLCRLLEESSAFFDTQLLAVRRLEDDEARPAMIEDWIGRIQRYHPPASFDDVVGVAASDMGRDHLDAVKFRKRHYERWAEALRSLADGYDFAYEARRLIEHSLLTDVTAALPITGSDIIREYGVGPGPEVGRLLAVARSSFEHDPCDKATLLARLRESASDRAPAL